MRRTVVRRYFVDIPNLERYEESLQTTYMASKVARDMILENLIANKMVKSGGLLKSFKIKKVGPREGMVYSDLEYSRIQDLGGLIKLTPKMRWKIFFIFGRLPRKNKKYINIRARSYTAISKSQLTKRIITEFKNG